MDVALAFVESPEADSRLVAAAYLDLLRRDPDPSGLAVWIGELQQGLTPSELAAIIASSDEFIELTANGGFDATIVPPVEVVDPVAVPVLIDPFFDPFLGGPFLGGVTVAVDVGVDPWFAGGGEGDRGRVAGIRLADSLLDRPRQDPCDIGVVAMGDRPWNPAGRRRSETPVIR